MTKEDRLLLNDLFGDNGKFIEISFRHYNKDGLFMEIEKNQNYFRFDTSIINGYYPIGITDINDSQSEYLKLIKNVFPTIENVFIFSDNLTTVSTEEAKKRKWTKLGQQFYGYDLYDFNCVFILKLPKNFNFKKINNIKFDIPNDICIVDDCTYEQINDFTISVFGMN